MKYMWVFAAALLLSACVATPPPPPVVENAPTVPFLPLLLDNLRDDTIQHFVIV